MKKLLTDGSKDIEADVDGLGGGEWDDSEVWKGWFEDVIDCVFMSSGFQGP